MKYKEIEHAADWAFHVSGRGLQELFIHAAQAICTAEHSDFAAPITLTHELQVEGVDRESLLVNWLNELLYMEQTKREAYRNFDILEMDDSHLRARVQGAPEQNCERHIKAVTFHNLEIKRTPSGLEATIVVDV